jgi:ribosomal protein S18 acetylase RimI-like enzyme
VKIRNLKLSDMEALAKLHNQFGGGDSCALKMRTKFEEIITNESYILICAGEGGMLAGSAMGVVFEELFGDCSPTLLVENFIVDRDFKHRGIGKALFAELEKRARARNCRQVLLVTEAYREEACGFYESVGFSPLTHRGFKKKL